MFNMWIAKHLAIKGANINFECFDIIQWFEQCTCNILLINNYCSSCCTYLCQQSKLSKLKKKINFRSQLRLRGIKEHKILFRNSILNFNDKNPPKIKQNNLAHAIVIIINND